MQYKVFRNLSLAGLTIFLVGGGYLLGRRAPAKPLPPVETAAPSSSAAASPPPASAPAPRAASPTLADSPPRGAHGDRIPLRDVDRELLRLYEQSQARKSAARAKAPKIKDVFPDRSYKVNLYEEDGLLARAKIDLNRNGKWDEKWTFAPGSGGAGDPVVKRQVSPSDDDTNYTLSYKLVDRAWVPSGEK